MRRFETIISCGANPEASIKIFLSKILFPDHRKCQQIILALQQNLYPPCAMEPFYKP